MRAVGSAFFPFLPRRMQKWALVTYRKWERRSERRRVVTKVEIAHDLTRLGVKPGDILYVHSSLSSIGQVLGGANAVIDAMLYVLGPTGTLVMPAFSMPYGGMIGTLEKGAVFDPESTPCTIGLIPETFRRRRDVLRSIHPTSSICALGAKADAVTRSEQSDFRSNFGVGTPLHRVMDYGAKVLGLGVSVAYVSFYHVIEDVLGDKFPVEVHGNRTYAAKVLDHGNLVTMHVRPLDPTVSKTRIDQPSSEWLRTLFTDLLIDRGILKIGPVGEARSWLMNAKELYEALVELAGRNVTIYTTEPAYRARGLHLISYVTGYKSSSSDRRHNYLEEQVLQIAKGHEFKGFWDSDSNNWIRQLNWNGSDWSGFVAHDWKYAMEMQEGATHYALLTGSRTLDNHLEHELKYIDSKVADDGSISGIPDGYPLAPEEYEYGAALSALALGYRHSVKKNGALADQIIHDLNLIHRFMTKFKPTYDDPSSVILRAYANLLSAYQLSNDADGTHTVLEQIDEYAQEFIRHQSRNGSFPLRSLYTGESGVHWQLKVDIALLLAYAFTNVERYLASAVANLDWVTRNLLMPNGALRWDAHNEDDFFEIHQMLFMIACRYLRNLSKGRYELAANCIRAWKFLLDANAAYIDMYVENSRSTGAFFSFRHIDSQGSFQKGVQGRFKGSYEIGYSLWALALNKDFEI
jgi:aminoglycoside 3-N-acetyltransferase